MSLQKIQVIPRKRMPLWTMSLLGIDGGQRVAAQCIYLSGYRLEVPGVTASVITTEMIKL